MVHSAAQLSDKIIAIGYQPADGADAEQYIGTADQLSDNWLAERDQILDLVLAEERRMTAKPDLQLEELLPFGLDDEIPTIAIQVTAPKTIELLRSMETIRYAEPMDMNIPSSLKRAPQVVVVNLIIA